jgi:hypothetical protein
MHFWTGGNQKCLVTTSAFSASGQYSRHRRHSLYNHRKESLLELSHPSRYEARDHLCSSYERSRPWRAATTKGGHRLLPKRHSRQRLEPSQGCHQSRWRHDHPRIQTHQVGALSIAIFIVPNPSAEDLQPKHRPKYLNLSRHGATITMRSLKKIRWCRLLELMSKTSYGRINEGVGHCR